MGNKRNTPILINTEGMDFIESLLQPYFKNKIVWAKFSLSFPLTLIEMNSKERYKLLLGYYPGKKIRILNKSLLSVITKREIDDIMYPKK